MIPPYRTRYAAKPLLFCLLIVAAVMAGCTGAREPAGGGTDAAIAAFIAGDHAKAIALLDETIPLLQSEEGLREAYYYLGRSYLELGQRDRAIDAFAAGVSYGDTGACTEYLERLKTAVEGRGDIARSEFVSRSQLAAALSKRFLEDALDEPGGVPERDATIRRVVDAGWMDAMPDGHMHGDARVTRASLMVTLARLGAALGVESPRLGALRRTLASRGTEPVSGREVAAALDELKELR